MEVSTTLPSYFCTSLLSKGISLIQNSLIVKKNVYVIDLYLIYVLHRDHRGGVGVCIPISVVVQNLLGIVV